ncbi:hypothetical protein DBZ36_05750 [Alginatibacterium sediminis]|uniref:HTH luxR-type domain-containing protein n=1 Tax=Alginatibacterium sediminis TaxID=2164068 RepID=A0A420EGW7_9ALTE|nr:hypothetical protein [Alginatibacterium sediminis]RKF19955.1 hypothetical protein DBZ36_05750 [Alginatibacterium sediminis]
MRTKWLHSSNELSLSLMLDKIEKNKFVSPKELSRLIGLIYTSAWNNDWAEALSFLMHLSGSNKAMLVLSIPSQHQPLIMEFHTNFDYEPDVLARYSATTAQDPYYQQSLVFSEGDCICFDKQLVIQTVAHQTYQNEVLSPLNAHQILGAVLLRNTIADAYVSVNRGELDLPYSEDDILLIEMLVPHFQQALKMFMSLQLYREYLSISQRVIEQNSEALLVCDKDAAVHLCNPVARQLIERSPWLEMHDNTLQITKQSLSTWFKSKCAKVASKCGQGINFGFSETIDTTSEHLTISVNALSQTSTRSEIKLACCLVTLSCGNVPNWQLVKLNFKLTASELSLVQNLYSKMKLKAISQRDGVSYNTLRSHLKSVFRKTQVSSQSELFIRLMELS